MSDGQERLPSRFKVREVLGEGRQGVVYRVFDTEREEEVALKSVDSSDADQRQDLKQEFGLLSDLSQHPNLVQPIELHVDERYAYFTMELVQGKHFDEYVLEGPALDDRRRGVASDIPRLRAAFEQLASGLARVHYQGLIHRDIKPKNVLVTDDGRVVLLDFGFARRNNEAFAGLAGTPPYMAPELLYSDPRFRERAGFPTDVYALGIMLYELLCGALPGSAAEVLQNQRAGLPSVLTARPDAPSDLAKIADALVSVDSKHRPEARDLVRKPPPPFQGVHGRSVEQDELWRGWQQTKSGPVLIEMRGDSGMGKSALLHQFCDQVYEYDATVVLRGRCHPRESIPYKALDAVMTRLAEALVDLDYLQPYQALTAEEWGAVKTVFPVLEQVPQVEAVPTVVSKGLGQAAFRKLFVWLTQHRDVIIFIDNLHWGDLDSPQFIFELLSAPELSRLMVLVAYESDTVDSSGLKQWRTRVQKLKVATHRFMELTALSSGDAERLFDGEVGDVSISKAQRQMILAEAQGNPLYLTLAASILQDFEPPPSGGVWDLLRFRYEQLPASAKALAQWVCLAGVPLKLMDILQMGFGSTADLVRLNKNHILRRMPAPQDHYFFPLQEQMARRVVKTIEPDRKILLHQKMAQKLAELPKINPLLVADHFEAGGLFESALPFVQTAAEQAMDQLAFEQAVQLYERMIRLEPQQPPRLPLLEAKAKATASAGRAVEAAKILREVAQRTEHDARTLEIREEVAELLIGAGHLSRGFEELDVISASIGLPGRKLGPAALAKVLYQRVRWWWQGPQVSLPLQSEGRTKDHFLVDVYWVMAGSLGLLDASDGLVFQTLHLAAALELKDPDRLVRAAAMELVYLGVTGRYETWLQGIERMIETLQSTPLNQRTLAFLELTYGYRDFLGGRFQTARPRFHIAAKRLHKLGGSRWERRLAITHEVFSTWYLGALYEAAKQTRQLSQEFEAADDRASLALLNLGVAYWVDLRNDEAEGALHRVQTTLAIWKEQTPVSLSYLGVLAQANIALYQGRYEDVLLLLKMHRTIFFKFRLFENARVNRAWLEGIARLTAGLRKKAPKGLPQALSETAKLLAKEAPWGFGFGHILEAGAARLLGQRDRMEDCLHRAEAAFLATGMRIYAATVRYGRGQWTQAPEVIEAAASELKAAGIKDLPSWGQMMMPNASS